jgi:hypothetical protein
MHGKFITAALFSGVLMALAPGTVLGDPAEGMPPQVKKGTTAYVTHFVFRPVGGFNVPGLTVTTLEMVGTTENMEGGKMLDKMSARCAAVSVESGDVKYLDGACALTDADGDRIFSTFDTREVDKTLPDRGCGTHFITGGTGKYAGMTGREPFACISLPPLAGAGDVTSLDIPHTTTWEIK